MINLMHLHLHQLHLRLVKNLKTTSDAEALAQAVSSLAPSKEEQEQRMLLLAEETHRKCNQENRDYLSWKRSECEKF